MPLRLSATLLAACLLGGGTPAADTPQRAHAPVFQMQPIGWVRKTAGRTAIEIDPQYEPALLGVDRLDAIWVLYWFDRNDTAHERSILQVHPVPIPPTPYAACSRHAPRCART